ncbi:hypothetical protein IAT38_003921 [Cryptococcus sp. DSM 104549]
MWGDLDKQWFEPSRGPGYTRWRNESLNPHFRAAFSRVPGGAKSSYLIEGLTTRPAYRKMGYASAILQTVSQVAREDGRRASMAVMGEGEPTGLEKQGFTQVYNEPFDWGVPGPHDRFIMLISDADTLARQRIHTSSPGSSQSAASRSVYRVDRAETARGERDRYLVWSPSGNDGVGDGEGGGGSADVGPGSGEGDGSGCGSHWWQQARSKLSR